MSYNLYIDDQIDDWDNERKCFIRDPKIIDPSRDYVAFKTVEESVIYIQEHGCPSFISFDYDLGQDLKGNVMQSDALAKWLVKMDMDTNKKFIPEDFRYQVHSRNVNAINNLDRLSKWLELRKDWIKPDDNDYIDY